MINNFRTQNFEQEVLQSSQPVMVDFWAPMVQPLPRLRTGIGRIRPGYPKPENR